MYYLEDTYPKKVVPLKRNMGGRSSNFISSYRNSLFRICITLRTDILLRGGGEEAAPGEFPHHVAVLRGGVGGSLMCAGSLISADRVLTAGHCCDGMTASRL